ncbi:12425_t:CDS:2 [Dentiscutata erythropus]|uniref:12425_t:CDS:1 n=1 Tax=Dentiscutata erythropus TaxID=1348616 RepID=A0A9N9EN04_9GLOM|nr:12425_t:CDS:2 [Dentiscutata erythropus]
MSETENWIYKSISEGHIQFITYDSFSNVEAIARGAFGEVSRAWWNSAEKYVALKTLYTNPESNKPDNDSFQDLVNEGMIQGGIGGGYQIPNQSGGYPPYNQSGGGYPMQNPGGLPMQNPGGRPIQNPGGRPIQNPGGYPIYNQNSGYPNPNQGAGYPNPSHGGYPIQNQGGNYPTQGPQMSYPMQDPRMAYVQRPFQNPNYPQNNKNPNYPQNNQNPNYPQNNQNPNYPQSNQNPNYPQSNQSMQMPTPPTMNNMQPSPYPQQNFKPPSRPDQPNFKPPSRPDQPNFKPPSRPDQPNTGYAAGVPPSQQIPPQYFQQRPPLQQFPMQPNQNIPNKNVMNQNVPNQNMLNQNIHIQSTQHQVPKQYSSMRPCMELLAKHADEHHSTFTGPDNCGAGYHVGYGDVVGLQFHLDNMSIPVDSDNFEFANKQEPLVLIASTYCSGRKLISILKCLKDYKADFSKFDPITKRTALHWLFENTVLRKDVTERSGGVRKYVDCVKDAIMILTSYEDVKRNCNINATDYEGKTILTCYMIDLFGNIKPEEKKEIVSSLLERGADPNKGCTIKSIFYTFEAPTALFMAIHYDWPTEIFSQIYKCKMGCDVNIKDTKQRNILSLAASERKPDYMKWLLENCADLSKPESMKLAFKHAGNFITKEYRTLQFFDKGKIKLIPEFDKKTSSRDNTNSK